MRKGRGPRPVLAADARGFTIIEVLIVLVILSILAGLAQPRFHQVLLKARAAEVVGDMDVIQNAVREYQADHHQWPPDRNRGQIPPGLEDYLPGGFSFVAERYVLDYDNWAAMDGSFTVGVTVIPEEEELGLAVMDLLGSGVWRSGSKYSWVIEP
jgi:prepilin-type N-terminal cleavage/methylation domain-containing protein